MAQLIPPEEDEIDAFKRRRALAEARAGWLIDAAMRDILRGELDSDAVQRAMQLGHHEEYSKLKEARDVAIAAARHSGEAT